MNIHGYKKHLKEMKQAREAYLKEGKPVNRIEGKIASCRNRLDQLKEEKGRKKKK